MKSPEVEFYEMLFFSSFFHRQAKLQPNCAQTEYDGWKEKNIPAKKKDCFTCSDETGK